ncbi:trypsin-like serine protease [Streptomyces sp. NPDC002690]
MKRARKYAAWAAGALVGVGTLGAPQAQAVVGDATAGQRPYLVKIEVGDAENGGHACSGALIEKRWIVTAASCFTDDPSQYASLAVGAPTVPARAVVGGADLGTTTGEVRDIVELVPRTDRDLVLARLASSVSDVTPVAIGNQAPAVSEELSVSGYGRTADEWVPGRPHSGAFTVTASSGPDLDIDAVDGAAVCLGDAGGPAVRTGADGDTLVAINSRSWQGGCLGSEATRHAAIETRLDDVTDWIAARVARWSLKSRVNSKYVSTELNYTGSNEGMLRARNDTRGGWEEFTLHTRDAGTSVELRSEANGLFVGTEINYTGDAEGMLRARSASPAGWEQFTLVPQGGQDYALKSTASGKYVSVENNYTGDNQGMVRARSESVATWERFTLEHMDNLRIAGADQTPPTPQP